VIGLTSSPESPAPETRAEYAYSMTLGALLKAAGFAKWALVLRFAKYISPKTSRQSRLGNYVSKITSRQLRLKSRCLGPANMPRHLYLATMPRHSHLAFRVYTNAFRQIHLANYASTITSRQLRLNDFVSPVTSYASWFRSRQYASALCCISSLRLRFCI
jgi:hypothetical protein